MLQHVSSSIHQPAHTVRMLSHPFLISSFYYTLHASQTLESMEEVFLKIYRISGWYQGHKWAGNILLSREWMLMEAYDGPELLMDKGPLKSWPIKNENLGNTRFACWFSNQRQLPSTPRSPPPAPDLRRLPTLADFRRPNTSGGDLDADGPFDGSRGLH